jgi:cell wall-associated NlpC family hydrolase
MDSLTSPLLKPLSSRAEAVACAQAWLGTPYALRGRVRGAGCDCATLLAEYLIEMGAADRSEMNAVIKELGPYSHDWFCHATGERYLLALMRFAEQIMTTFCRGTIDAKPGTLVLFRVVGSHRWNHGAIVTAWPLGIHSLDPRVTESDLTMHPMTSFHEMALFDPWAGRSSDGEGQR